MYYKNKSCFRCSGFGSYTLILPWTMWVSFDCVLITQNPSGQVTLTPYDAYMTSLYFRGPVAGSFQHTLWPRGRASQATLLVRGAFAFIFGWYKVIIALFDHNRSLYNVKPSYILLTLRASWFAWCLSRIYQLNKSRCRCRWDVTIEYLAYIRETIDSSARGPYVSSF